jgi:hypothetical protein
MAPPDSGLKSMPSKKSPWNAEASSETSVNFKGIHSVISRKIEYFTVFITSNWKYTFFVVCIMWQGVESFRTKNMLSWISVCLQFMCYLVCTHGVIWNSLRYILDWPLLGFEGISVLCLSPPLFVVSLEAALWFRCPECCGLFVQLIKILCSA